MIITNHRIDHSSNLVVSVEKELEFPLVPYWKHECKHYNVFFRSFNGKICLDKNIGVKNKELAYTVLDPDSGEILKHKVFDLKGELVICRPLTDRHVCISRLARKWSFIWYEDDEEKWRLDTDLSAFDYVNGEFVALNNRESTLEVHDPKTGALLRQQEGVIQGGYEFFDSGRKILYNSTLKTLVCRDFKSFELLWEFDWKQFKPNERVVRASLRIVNGFIYCQCCGKAFCLEAQTGNLVWINDEAGRLMHVVEGKLYLSGAYDITCIDCATGQTIYKTHYKKDKPGTYTWMKCSPRNNSAFVVGKHLLSHDNDWLLSVADLDIGEVIWEVPKKGHFEGGMMYLDGKLYISSYPHLWCFGPKEGQPAEARKKRLGNNLKWEDLRLLP